MSPKRRSALIPWARRRHALIVEDDYDAEYRYDRASVASLQGLAPDRVAYCATTSKTLAPAQRLAWMVLPPQLAKDVTRQYADTWATPSVIEQAAASAGLHVTAWLAPDADEAAIAAEALRRRVAVHTLHRHRTAIAAAPPALILGYAQLAERRFAAPRASSPPPRRRPAARRPRRVDRSQSPHKRACVGFRPAAGSLLETAAKRVRRFPRWRAR
jgi:GntR family transcriptional regulator/MocR family aminotransferase